MKYIILIFLLVSWNTSVPQSIKDINLNGNEINKVDAEANKTGIWFVYDQNRTVAAAYHYINGKRNGSFEVYNENGDITQKGYYKAGVLDSVLFVYNDKMHLISESNYKNGKLHGLGIYYNNEGEIISRQNYIYGELDLHYDDAYEAPRLISDAHHSMFENKLDTVFFTAKGVKNGTGYRVYRNDSIIYEVVFSNDNKLIERFIKDNIVEKIKYYNESSPYNIKRIIDYSKGSRFPIIEDYDDEGVKID